MFFYSPFFTATTFCFTLPYSYSLILFLVWLSYVSLFSSGCQAFSKCFLYHMIFYNIFLIFWLQFVFKEHTLLHPFCLSSFQILLWFIIKYLFFFFTSVHFPYVFDFISIFTVFILLKVLFLNLFHFFITTFFNLQFIMIQWTIFFRIVFRSV